MIGLSCLHLLLKPSGWFSRNTSNMSPRVCSGPPRSLTALLPPVLPPPHAAPSFTASLLPRKLLPSLLPHAGTESATPCHPAVVSSADEALPSTFAQHLASGPPAVGRSSESYLGGEGQGRAEVCQNAGQPKRQTKRKDQTHRKS